MNYEVEVKYALPDVAGFRQLLELHQARFVRQIRQEDLYLNHPCRDFAETDEAFRIRKIGEENRLTFKGPLLDQATKTREEIELNFAEGTVGAEQMQSMLEKLGFRSVYEVCKTRDIYEMTFLERHFEVVIDHVDHLGWYVELECTVPESEREQAQEDVLRLAKELGLGPHSERRSYLRLLLAQNLLS